MIMPGLRQIQKQRLDRYCALLVSDRTGSVFLNVDLPSNLTHLSRMEFPTDINWTSQFPILGLLGGIFHSI